jgi:hypothetical protein
MNGKWFRLVCCACPMFYGRLMAQGGGSVVGEVHDPTGALMAEAKVTVLNTATSVATLIDNREIQLPLKMIF